MLEWVKSEGDMSAIKDNVVLNKYISEDELCSQPIQNNVNVVTGDPGMGKSWFLRKLKQSYFEGSFNKRPIYFSSDEIYNICHSILKTGRKHEAFLDYVIELKYSSYMDFEKLLFKLMMRNGKILYLWDGIDELLSDEDINNFLEFIKSFPEHVSTHWLTSRTHLKDKMEKKFNLISRTISKLSDEQQIGYMEKRLKDATSNDLKAIKDFVRHQNIMSIPLQIFILTELCIRDPTQSMKILTSQFSIANMYKHFVDETLIVYYKEKRKEEITNKNRVAQQLKEDIKKFGQIAISLVLDPKHLDDLNITPPNLENIDSDSIVISIGFIKMQTIEDTSIPRFVHFSYAEYFIARYFAEHRPPRHENIIFQKRYKNIRFFFDTILAENCPAHNLFLNKNFAALKNYKDEMMKDLGGRNVLQVACSWGTPLKTVTLDRNDKIELLHEWEKDVAAEDADYVDMLKYLSKKCNPLERDDLFQIDSYAYAERSHCIIAQAVVEQECSTGFYSHQDNALNYTVVIYAVRFGFQELLRPFDNLQSIATTEDENLLYLSLKWGQDETARLLINSGFDINGKDYNGKTVLHYSCYKGDDKVTTSLISHGASVNAADNAGNTALHYATARESPTCITLLIKHGAQINGKNQRGWTPIHWAAKYGHDSVAEHLRQNSADIHTKDRKGWTPLHEAAYSGHQSMVKYLVQHGAVTNEKDKKGWTALHGAAYNGHDSVIDCLKQHGAHINAKDMIDWTPLHLAAAFGHYASIKVLMQHNADINAECQKGRTPLYWAIANGHNAAVTVLMHHVAGITVECQNDATPLHWAARNRHDAAIKVLLQHAADINAKCQYGQTPLHKAAGYGHDAAIKVLMQHNADINAKCHEGCTPLHYAAYKGHDATIKVLMQHGADINAVDQFGKTPLHLACQNNHEIIVQLLEQLGARR